MLACDTETAGGEITTLPRRMPRLVLASVCNGDRSVGVPRDRIDDFVLGHAHDRAWVFHNSSFDVWVLAGHLGSPAREALFRMIDQDRIRDTYCLADAIEMFETGLERSATGRLTLESLAKRYLGRRLDKTLQTDFSTVEDRPLDCVPQEHLAYAAADAQATFDLYAALAS
jgi:ribonuclease D